MDETVKPVRIPPEMSVYAEKHEIFDLVQVIKYAIVAITLLFLKVLVQYYYAKPATHYITT